MRRHWTLRRFILLAFTLSPRLCEALLPYISNALFDPTIYGLDAWPLDVDSHEMAELGGDWYNPAIAMLPSALRHELSLHYDRNVTYLVVLKRNLEKSNCANLIDNDAVTHTFPVGQSPYGDDLVSSRMSEQLVLVDDHKRPVEKSLTLTGDNWVMLFIKRCGDIRLEAGKDETKILAHAHAIVGPQQFRYAFWWFEIKVDSANHVFAEVTRFEHFDVTDPEPWLKFQAQNIGVLWNGGRDEPFQLVYWLGTQLDSRPGIPPVPYEAPQLVMISNGLPDPRHNKSLHNTGSPILLDGWCPGMALALGHSHIDTVMRGHRNALAQSGETRWGNTYVHNVVLYNATPPYRSVAVSPPFCFPSVDNHSTKVRPLCDVIQFVTTFARVPGDRILFGYGINDCESAWFEIPIEELLRFTEATLFDDGRCTVPSDSPSWPSRAAR